MEFGHISPDQCNDCKVFAKYYGGIGDGAACMHQESIKRFQQAKERACPLVILDRGNELAADLLWMAMAPRFNPFFEALRSQLEKIYTPIKVLRALRRSINAMQGPEAMQAMGLSGDSKPKMPKKGSVGKRPPSIPRRPQKRR